MTVLNRSIFLLPLLALSCAARATDVGGCVSIADDSARLACYDRAAGRNASAAPAAAPVNPKAAGPASSTGRSTSAAQDTSTTAQQPSPDAEFGESSLRANTPASQKPKQHTPSEITATIVEIAHRPRGELIVTLDNSQVWEQRDTRRLPIKVGDTVKIRARSLGSFRLIGPTGRTIAVARIR